MLEFIQTYPHTTPNQKRVSLTWTLTSVPTLWTISTLFPGVHSVACPDMGFPTSAIANQESLSGLETEMRKLEGVVTEIVEELEYLKRREERFQTTNGAFS